MLFLNNALRSSPEYKELCGEILKGRLPSAATGLAHIHKAALIDTLRKDTKRRALVVVADESEGARIKSDLILMGAKVIDFPSRDLILRDISGVSREYEHARLGALSKIIDGDYDVVVCGADALLSYTIPPEILMANRFTLKAEQTVPPAEVCARLVSAGYTRCDTVEGVGQFALRGGILDIFPPDADNPYRIEFWGDDIDSICIFDTMSQRRDQLVDEVLITPVLEVLTGDSETFARRMSRLASKVEQKSKFKAYLQKVSEDAANGILPLCADRFMPLLYTPATLLDYTADCLTFVSEANNVKERCRTYLSSATEDVTALFEQGMCPRGWKICSDYDTLCGELENRETVWLDTFTKGSYDTKIRSAVSFTLRQLSVWGGMTAQLAEDIAPLCERGYAVAVLAGTDKAAHTVANDLRDSGLNAYYSPDADALTGGTVTVMSGSLSAGMDLPKASFALFTYGKTATSKKSRIKKNANAFNSLDELHRGDYVVHLSHGIGVFDGINTITTAGITKDYIKIKYAGKDVLYVPVTQLDLVSKYIGSSEDGGVRLNRLGGDGWKKTRGKVRSALKDIAKELIKLYAERMARPGWAFSPDTDLQADFESRFEYDETEDQLRCIHEIKRDMESTAPMDRLLCGDVGFGKTEVALRAAFKCVADGKQCAILVPTTILAWQHYQTATKRLEGMPVTVELLSRFRSPKQQTDIRRRLKNGEIDIVVGTHKLIGAGVEFRDLGLLIIDEEQRFGVAQKEKLREKHINVDTLTLSATPIPRTLNMAMSGLRDMSSLDEAPGDRYPVQTYVMEYDKSVVLDAIRRELRRGGQVYYLYNSVEFIASKAARLQEELPDAAIAIAHGQMAEEELSEVWRRLIAGEIDILVCTTIIETGVDVPNVNTLIIEDADRMGLSQLHQIRGRVGRSSRRAYAYLTYRLGKAVSDVAAKRLDAIREFTEFGSGFKIAMRDLEIRGAGNILGGEQSGHMISVGYDMYIRMLNDAISAEKGEEVTPEAECVIDLQIGAHIPESYIASLQARLGMYRRIADIRTPDDALDVTDELIDRFGEPPKSVKGLIDIALIRNRCIALGIQSVEQQENYLRIYPDALKPQHIAALSGAVGKLFRVNAGSKPFYEIRIIGSLTPYDVMEGAVSAMEKAEN